MENMINYPIKYAVLEIKEKGGWLVGYKEITQGFIVSKCYVVESKVTYKSDGSSIITHKVVFPYDDIQTFKYSFQNGGTYLGEENTPRYDACNNPYPVRVVDELFDTYYDAKVKAEVQNEEYRSGLGIELSTLDPDWLDKYHLLKQDFESNLAICYLYEELVIDKTLDMKVLTIDEPPVIRVLKPLKKEQN